MYSSGSCSSDLTASADANFLLELINELIKSLYFLKIYPYYKTAMTFYTTLNREQRYNLIELVKERPVLYDKRHRLFRSVKEKEYRWKEISQLLNKSEVACKKAWKTIRDQYNRYTVQMAPMWVAKFVFVHL
ncbi:uncharacterized protein [Musca autumnalis]|uniref:uncharacterized protein n=1 Tax=Musca autumnalis TaxID=221902 RepID=UPI003CEF8131